MRLIISNLHKSYKDKTVLNGVILNLSKGKYIVYLDAMEQVRRHCSIV